MTGSMYAAIAGLQTHMQKMNVIGNNIANANTYGFKPGVTSFTESMYTSSKASTAGGTQYGGTNAAQIGYGSKIGSIDLNFAQGTYSPTGVNSHLYLDGNGFFLVGPKPEDIQGVDPNGTPGDAITGYYKPDPNSLTLTRVGNFWLDSDGYLVDINGNCVYGFMPQGEAQPDATGSNIKTEDGNIVWNACLQPIRLPLAAPKGDGGFKENGAIYPTLGDPRNGNPLTYPDNGGDDKKANMNTTVKVSAVNLSVGQNGVITAVTDAGDPITVGVIAVGSVINPNGLTKLSNGYYQGGNNAGDLTVGTCTGVLEDRYLNNADGAANPEGAIGNAGKSKIIAGGLESSKTDIATEFADLITAQRGFQANTKIITVTDEMLADLVSMKR